MPPPPLVGHRHPAVRRSVEWFGKRRRDGRGSGDPPRPGADASGEVKGALVVLRNRVRNMREDCKRGDWGMDTFTRGVAGATKAWGERWAPFEMRRDYKIKRVTQ